MIQYMSLGKTCNVKYQIDKFKGNKETLLFDRVVTDMDSVISLLFCEDINKFLNLDNIKFNLTDLPDIVVVFVFDL